ncbi:MAG: hypothetical protein K9L87_01410 [Candidatus Omnitrophica bacterium]|nr:hypothetical protein [Candidatus Omnitrophota bacterium]MCF7897401.1 hypothetical protein [Candidatus Omnitrophota bacterium]MCF7909492.1 hypothetical protein [Candidatus Omnitrophota bacterium]
MSNLVLNTISDKNILNLIERLKAQQLYKESFKCAICGKHIEKNNIGAFLPDYGKISPVCNKLSCILKSTYQTMKYNGNGSPIVEER